MISKRNRDLNMPYVLGENFELIWYDDAEYYLVYRKSTSGMAQFLGSFLISWGSKNQN